MTAEEYMDAQDAFGMDAFTRQLIARWKRSPKMLAGHRILKPND